MGRLSNLKEIGQVATAYAVASAVYLYAIGSVVALGFSFKRSASEFENLAVQYTEIGDAYNQIENSFRNGESFSFNVDDSLRTLNQNQRTLNSLKMQADENFRFSNHLKNASKSWAYVF